MIDLQKELEKFQRIDIEKYKENLYISDFKIKESIDLYNEALVGIKTNKGQDIAIIKLKKSISLRKNFSEAIVLLALCYLVIDEKDKSYEVLKKYIKDNENNMLVLTYLFDIKGESVLNELGLDYKEKIVEDSDENKIKENNFFETVFKSKNLNIKNKKETKKFVSGILVGFICIMLISSPFYFGVKKSSKEIESIINKEKNSYSKLDKKYEALNESYKELKNDKISTMNEVEYYKNYTKLIKAEEHVSKNEYEEAADILVVLKSYNFDGDEKKRFDDLYENTLNNALDYLLLRSIDLYYANEYDNSLEKLDKIILYNNNWENIDDVYYYKGLNYYSLEDREKALDSFNNVIGNFQESNYYKSSEDYISMINNIKNNNETD